MRQLIYKSLMVLVVTFSLWGCKSFMEFPPAAELNIDKIFEQYTEAEKLMNSMYTYCVPLFYDCRGYGGGFGNSRFSVGTVYAGGITDEGQVSQQSTGSGIHKYYNGNLTASAYPEDDYSYKWITLRKAFILIKNIHRVPDASQDKIKRIEGESKLMIALVYFEMWKRYGGVPLVTFAYDGSEPLDQINKPRASFDAVYKYIITMIDDVIKNYDGVLPAKVSDLEFGRFPMALAYALKARVELYAASPLFNTDQPYNVALGEKSNLICFMKPYDKNRWKVAADAASAAITYCTANGYSIVDNPSQREDGWNYTIASQEFPTKGNSEVIWGLTASGNVDGYYKLNAAVKGIRADFTTSSTSLGVGANQVPVNQLMRYEIDDDITPGQYPDWTQPKEFALEGVSTLFDRTAALTTAQKVQVKLALATAARKYYEDVKLDPRFYASIIYNGDPNYGDFGATGDVDMADARALSNNAIITAENGQSSDSRRQVTCPMYVRKFQRGYETRVNSTKSFNIYMRLAELYLIRAEAENEYYLSPSQVPDNRIYSDLGVIRSRSGMVNVSANADQTTMRQLIAHERQVEFFYEDQRWFDLRRTRQAPYQIPVIIYKPIITKWYKTPSHKVPLKITYALGEVTIGEQTKRYWSDKMYMNPIPESEMNKFYGLIQNPGW